MEKIKSGVTKLLTKIEITSVELEHVNSESVTESKKLTGANILIQLRAKQEQIVELDDAIAAKIQTVGELEEETCNADTYKLTLEECITFLTKFSGRLSSHHPHPPIPQLHHGR